jgi:predicted peroxiredoxin
MKSTWLVMTGLLALLAFGYSTLRSAEPPGGQQQPTVVVSVTSGGDDLLAVTTAFHLAEHSLAHGRTAVLFFNVHGPVVASKRLPETAKLGDDPPIRRQLAELIRKGVKVYVCPYCVKVAGLRKEDLVPGVEMATPEKIFAHLHADSVVFTY